MKYKFIIQQSRELSFKTFWSNHKWSRNSGIFSHLDYFPFKKTSHQKAAARILIYPNRAHHCSQLLPMKFTVFADLNITDLVTLYEPGCVVKPSNRPS